MWQEGRADFQGKNVAVVTAKKIKALRVKLKPLKI